MTDLRALLGGKYDDTIEKALIAADKGGYYVTRGYIDEGDVGKILAAVLPDLLAEAWDAGYAQAVADHLLMYDNSDDTPNPYRRTTEGDPK